MFVNSGKHLSRRALLRGTAGVAVRLPFLQAMIPALSRAQEKLQPKRMGVVYFPNGFIPDTWTPKTAGRDFELLRSLEPLAPFREKMTIVSGLATDPSKTINGFHDRAIGSFMTGIEMTRGKHDSGMSVDQIAAQTLGKQTPFRSLEVAIQEKGLFDGPCYASPTNRLPFERNPRFLFERLFGDADRLDPAALAKLRERQRSILDGVTTNSSALLSKLGGEDRVKVNEYLDSVRDIERRLAILDNLAEKKLDMERPSGIPDHYAAHVKMMMDLQLVALQTDMTRVWTFMMGMEASDMTFPDLNWDFSHHLTSHHGNAPEKVEAMRKINRYQVELLTYLLTKMDQIQEPGGTLLDNSVLMYASSLGNGSAHVQIDLPVILFGGRAMGVRGGKHIKMPTSTPITNLYVSMLDKVGVPIDRVGDSTGELPGLSDV